jgi:hypothetical protein
MQYSSSECPLTAQRHEESPKHVTFATVEDSNASQKNNPQLIDKYHAELALSLAKFALDNGRRRSVAPNVRLQSLC